MRIRTFLRGWAHDKRGTIAILFGLLTPVLVGGMAVGVETSYWYVSQRNQQNAADAAAMAAATNAGANYAVEAKAVAAQYGFVDGAGNVTVTATNSAACPAGGNSCYSVTIARAVPLYLTQVVGYRGDTSLADNGHGKLLRARAVAKQGAQDRQYCLLALSSVGTDFVANGGPKADLTGCSIMSNSSAVCNGSNLNADYGDAHITSTGCGLIQESGIPIVPDPYSSLASNIPADTCGGAYPQEPNKNSDPALPASNSWSGSKALNGNVQVCGDLQLTADVMIDAPAGAVLIVRNGQLDTNGHTLKTANGSAVTVVFSGTNGGSSTHAPTGKGTIDIQAPTSGPWSGVALYQDPGLTDGVNIADAGNSPTWDITGLVYLPHADVVFSGAVNKSSNGASCFVMVADILRVNGTASILSTGGCAAAGLSMPTGQVPGRGKLVS